MAYFDHNKNELGNFMLNWDLYVRTFHLFWAVNLLLRKFIMFCISKLDLELPVGF